MKKILIMCLTLVLALGALGVGYASWTDTVYIDGTVNTGSVCMSILCPITSDDPSLSPEQTGYIPPFPGMGQDKNARTSGPNFYINPIQTTKNVGWVTTNCPETPPGQEPPVVKEVVITLHNVYPCYWNHISFGVLNCGTIPIKLDHLQFLDVDGNPLWGHDANGHPINIIKQDTYVSFDLSGNNIDDLEVYWGDNWSVQIEQGGSWDISFWLHVLQDEGIDFTVPQNFTFKAAITGVQWNNYPLTLP
jgi:hypothetical protein